MAEAKVGSPRAAWVGAGQPNETHPGGPRLRLTLNQHESYLRFKNPVPLGDTASVAKLRVTVAQGGAGSFTITAKRVASRVDLSDLKWNNRPPLTGASATVTVTAPTEGTVLELDVPAHVQKWANGEKNFGWWLTSNSATPLRLYGPESEYPPTLDVTHAGKPGTATDLTPNGVVGVTQPVLSFSAPDISGDDEVAAVQVQIDTAPVVNADGSWATPDFDSGEVPATVPELDLATTAFTGLTATHKWQVRWKSATRVWSPWSDDATLTYTAKPALTISSPTGGVVEDSTPPLIAAFAGTAESWRVRVLDSAGEVYATSRRKPATSNTISWTPDVPLQDGETYTAEFRVWTNEGRSPSPGDPVYVQAMATFTVTEDATVTPPVLVAVTEDPTLPLARVEFTRAVAPDSFIVRRDGVTVATGLNPADLLLSGTTYAWTDPDASPLTPHTYVVRAVVNRKRSAPSNAVEGTVAPTGLWLVSQDRTRWVRFRGDGIDDWGVEDQVGLFTVHGRPELVQIRAAIGALGGSFAGEIDTMDGRPLADSVADLEAMNRAGRPVTLVAVDYAHLVTLRNVVAPPHPMRLPNVVRRRASFQFIEARTPRVLVSELV